MPATSDWGWTKQSDGAYTRKEVGTHDAPGERVYMKDGETCSIVIYRK